MIATGHSRNSMSRSLKLNKMCVHHSTQIIKRKMGQYKSQKITQSDNFNLRIQIKYGISFQLKTQHSLIQTIEAIVKTKCLSMDFSGAFDRGTKGKSS